MADKKDDDLHAEGIKIYEYAVERDSHNRERYAADIRFARLNEQWPEEIRTKREQDGRPCLTLNKLKSFIRQVVNDARQNKPAIKYLPVGDGADEWTAKVRNGLVRNIENTSNADVAYDTAIDNAVSGNVGYLRVVTDYASEDVFEQDIRIERVADSLSVVPDAYALDADSANWMDAFITDDYSIESFKAKWPKADTSSFEGDQRGMATGWLGDGVVRVAEWWKRREEPATLILLSDGSVMFEEQYLNAMDLLEVQGITIVDERETRTMKVTQHIMNGCEILETKKWAGKYIPIIPVYGEEVVIDGKRYLFSMHHDAHDAQQSYNFWRTNAAEIAGNAPRAPFVGPTGAFASDPNWHTANSANHAYLEYDGEIPPQRMPFNGPDAASMQEAMNASDDIKSILGLFDASLGAQSNETSGRAILARQREGDTSTFNFTDNLSRAIRHAGRVIDDMIPKIYTTKRIIRLLEEDGSTKEVKVNQPTEPLPEELKAKAEMEAGITRVYDLTSGKYDVTCESGPSYATKRQESAESMIEFIQAVPGAGQIIGPRLAKALDWEGAAEIAEDLKALLPPQLQGQNPQLMQAQQQMQQMQGVIQQLQQQLADAARDKELESRKLDIDGHKADTDRLKALGVTLDPMVAASMGLQVVQSASQALNGPDITPGGPQPIPAQAGMPQPEPQPQPAAPQPMEGMQ